MSDPRPAIYVLHENEEWVAPLRAAVQALGTPYREWHLGTDARLADPPPEGVFYGRISASSHTRNHRSTPELAAAVLEWLAGAGRRVVNGARAVDLEISKARQYVALAAHGVSVPEHEIATGPDGVLAAVARLGFPLIVKPNRGGKGAGVQRFDRLESLAQAARAGTFEPGPDGLLVVQRYVAPVDRSIVRCEFVAGELLYAVRVDASRGFELCPADACEVGDALCATSAGAPFEILPDLVPPDLERYRRFLADNAVEIAGIEYLVDAEGAAWTYDVNVNTNYNARAEDAAGLSGTERAGMRAVAAFLRRELHRTYPELAAA